ncbi:MAG: hypothetical protein D6698_10810 [Gammaproteobacteria bacterium]|nr:MAG: hypothetical protein D6698_10810 [Gammaproteobacteria bacterium]
MRLKSNLVKYLLTFCLAAFSGQTFAVSLNSLTGNFFDQDKVLDHVDSTYSGGRHRVVVHFTVPLQLQKKEQVFRGKSIRIPVEIHPENARDAVVEGESQLIFQPTSKVPLDQITFKDSFFGNELLILDFTRPVVIRVTPGRGKQSVIIVLEEKGFEKEGHYVVNLMATHRRPRLEEFKALKEFQGGRLYITSKEQDNETLYFLKVGDYQTREIAEKVAAKIQKYYPGAFVTGKKGVVSKIAEAVKPVTRVAKPVSKVEKGVKPRKPPRITKPVTRPKPTTPEGKRLDEMMKLARKALAKKHYQDAINFFEAILQAPNNQAYAQEAQELYGLARERNGQLAHAKAEYEKYLKLYPEGEGSERVRQRLLVLITQGEEIPEEVDKKRRKVTKLSDIPMKLFGGLSQFYRMTGSKDSDLYTFMDLSTKNRVNGWDIRTQITGSHDETISGSASAETDLSELYVDVDNRVRNFAFKIGRQRLNNSGIFGRFDGVILSRYDLSDRKYNLLFGKPVDQASDIEFNKEKTFYGVSIDAPFFEDIVDLNGYFVNQTISGITDRRAAGVETNVFYDGLSMFSLLDYDISYNDLNIFLLSGNWNKSERFTLHLTYDLRQNPFLSTENALQNSTAATISELKQSLTEAQIRLLAENSTNLSKLYNAGASFSFAKKQTLRGDFTFTSEDINQLPADGSISTSILPTTNNNYFYSLQWLSDDLFKKDDISILQLQYSDTDTAYTYRLTASSRLPMSPRFRVIPLFQLSYVNGKAGNQGGSTLRPEIRLEYRLHRNLIFELESNIDLLNNNPQVGTGNLENFFLNAGYRWIF